RERVKNGRDSSLRKQNEELLEKLRRSLEQADGLETVFARHMKNREGKYIVFCSGKNHMEEMISHVGEWFHLVDRKPHIYRISCDDSGVEKQFEAFRKDESCHLKLLFCIDMLNEGVHVEGVDGVVLLRPTISPTLYLQQIGRGLAAGRKKRGQPVIFDIVNNFESLSSVDSLQGEFEQALVFWQGAEEERTKYQCSFRVIDELLDC
ncbi:MAG TPA: DNA/RNA helicase, partial [Lachnospiraceae bacterium]|nr:DNA/RNA helicase [Lachnospiraceae bacterium]